MANHDKSSFEGPYEGHRRSLDNAKGLVVKAVTIGKKAIPALRYGLD